MDQPTAEQALRQLKPLVGEWTLEAEWPDGKPWWGGGRVTFEWHSSGAHLIERGTAELPEAPGNVSIIGCDAANGTYFQLYSDARGVCRVYGMSIGHGEWKLWRERAVLPALHSNLQRRREHDHRTLGDRRRRHQLLERLGPYLPQSLTASCAAQGNCQSMRKDNDGQRRAATERAFASRPWRCRLTGWGSLATWPSLAACPQLGQCLDIVGTP